MRQYKNAQSSIFANKSATWIHDLKALFSQTKNIAFNEHHIRSELSVCVAQYIAHRNIGRRHFIFFKISDVLSLTSNSMPYKSALLVYANKPMHLEIHFIEFYWVCTCKPHLSKYLFFNLLLWKVLVGFITLYLIVLFWNMRPILFVNIFWGVICVYKWKA